MFSRIKRWLLLRKAKKEANKHIPTNEEINKEHEVLLKQEEELKDFILKGDKIKKVTTQKQNRKKSKKKNTKKITIKQVIKK
jgi:hypothetical protein